MLPLSVLRSEAWLPCKALSLYIQLAALACSPGGGGGRLRNTLLGEVGLNTLQEQTTTIEFSASLLFLRFLILQTEDVF